MARSVVKASQLIALLKGAGHKYLKRVPAGVTKTGKTRYRYYYHVGHGGGIGHADHFQVGAAFAYKDGHYHVTASDGDTVTVRHDETGETRTVSKEALTKMLHEHHAEARQAHKERLHREIKAAEAAGATRQHARLMKEAQKHGFAPKAKPQPKAQKGAKMQDQEAAAPPETQAEEPTAPAAWTPDAAEAEKHRVRLSTPVDASHRDRVAHHHENSKWHAQDAANYERLAGEIDEKVPGAAGGRATLQGMAAYHRRLSEAHSHTVKALDAEGEIKRMGLDGNGVQKQDLLAGARRDRTRAHVAAQAAFGGGMSPEGYTFGAREDMQDHVTNAIENKSATTSYLRSHYKARQDSADALLASTGAEALEHFRTGQIHRTLDRRAEALRAASAAESDYKAASRAKRDKLRPATLTHRDEARRLYREAEAYADGTHPDLSPERRDAVLAYIDAQKALSDTSEADKIRADHKAALAETSGREEVAAHLAKVEAAHAAAADEYTKATDAWRAADAKRRDAHGHDVDEFHPSMTQTIQAHAVRERSRQIASAHEGAVIAARKRLGDIDHRAASDQTLATREDAMKLFHALPAKAKEHVQEHYDAARTVFGNRTTLPRGAGKKVDKALAAIREAHEAYAEKGHAPAVRWSREKDTKYKVHGSWGVTSGGRIFHVPTRTAVGDVGKLTERGQKYVLEHAFAAGLPKDAETVTAEHKRLISASSDVARVGDSNPHKPWDVRASQEAAAKHEAVVKNVRETLASEDPGGFEPRFSDKAAPKSASKAAQRARKFAANADADRHRPELWNPWHVGGKMLATDGVRAIAIPTEEGTKDGAHPHPKDTGPQTAVSAEKTRKLSEMFDMHSRDEQIPVSSKALAAVAQHAISAHKLHDGEKAKSLPMVYIEHTGDGHVQFHSRHPSGEVGEGVVHRTPAAPKHEGTRALSAVNANFLLDAVHGAGGPVKLGVVDEYSPVSLKREDGEHHIIMPLRV